MCMYTRIYIIINVRLYIISVYAHKVINATEFADATNLLSQTAGDVSLINVAVSFTLQKNNTQGFYNFLRYRNIQHVLRKLTGS